MKPSLLIVEDDLTFRNTLALEFEERGYLVEVASTLKDIQSADLLGLQFAVVDLRLGAESGLACLEYIKKTFRECRVVMITGYGSIATAVAAMKLGAFNYITKPFDVSSLEKSLWVSQETEDRLQSQDQKLDRQSLDRHEREYIEYVLTKCGGNISRAAQWLGIHRQSLQRKLRKYPPGPST